MSATEARNVREVVARVIAADRVSRGLPAETDEEVEAANLVAIAKAARRH